MTGRNNCGCPRGAEWQTALIELAKALAGNIALEPMALCNGQNLAGYVAVMYQATTGVVTPIYLDTNFHQVSALPMGLAPCQGNIQIDQVNFVPLFQTVETVCVLLPGATEAIEAQRITVRDATNTILMQTLEDIATQGLISGQVVECGCA